MSLMKSAQSNDDKNRRRNAVLYRDGLLLCLLSTRMWRRGAWAKMQLGRHLVFEGDSWWLRSLESQTNKRNPDAPLPAFLTAPMLAYLEVYRPVLSGNESDDGAVWITYRGRPLTGPDLFTAIATRTKAAFGEAMSPHMFRRLGPTTIFSLLPQRTADSALILGQLFEAPTSRGQRAMVSPTE